MRIVVAGAHGTIERTAGIAVMALHAGVALGDSRQMLVRVMRVRAARQAAVGVAAVHSGGIAARKQRPRRGEQGQNREGGVHASHGALD